jgi:membrane protease YdiL (CAAX protease family)
MPPEPATAGRRGLLAGTAWVVLLLVSDLPEVLLRAAGAGAPSVLPAGKVVLLAGFLALALAVRALRPLVPYAVVLTVLFGSLLATGRLHETGWYRGRFDHAGVSFFSGFLAAYVLDVAVALAVLAALALLYRRREAFFLVRGDLGAPIAPVPWLGIRRAEPWRPFVPIFAAAAAGAVLVPTVLAMRPTTDALLRALPLLPAVLLFAAVNAFTEEVYFRAALLATLHETVGRRHALLLTIVFFGLAHWIHGSPPGLVGAAMTGFLAFLLGKAMLETRGFLAPWFIHFVPDVVVFASYALARASQ